MWRHTRFVGNLEKPFLCAWSRLLHAARCEQTTFPIFFRWWLHISLLHRTLIRQVIFPPIYNSIKTIWSHRWRRRREIAPKNLFLFEKNKMTGGIYWIFQYKFVHAPETSIALSREENFSIFHEDTWELGRPTLCRGKKLVLIYVYLFSLTSLTHSCSLSCASAGQCNVV